MQHMCNCISTFLITAHKKIYGIIFCMEISSAYKGIAHNIVTEDHVHFLAQKMAIEYNFYPY